MEPLGLEQVPHAMLVFQVVALAIMAQRWPRSSFSFDTHVSLENKINKMAF